MPVPTPAYAPPTLAPALAAARRVLDEESGSTRRTLFVVMVSEGPPSHLEGRRAE
jgi:hypothetical protein